MNIQMKKYKESLKSTLGPVRCPSIKMDLSGMIKYAKAKGVCPVDLTEEEKAKFIRA